MIRVQMGRRPESFERIRKLPVVGRVADWGMGPSAVSRNTKKAGARIAGLKATESVCPYCAVGCGQVVYTRDGELVDIEGNPRSPINRSEEHTSELQSRQYLVCRLLLEKKKTPYRSSRLSCM